MNKAILIMDMPECCADCRLSDEGKFCKYENSQIFELVENNEGFMTENIGLTKKPDWCPLREVPKRKPGSGLPQYDEILGNKMDILRGVQKNRMTYKEEIRDLFTVPEDYYLAHCISADFGMGKGIVVGFNKRFDMKNKLKSKYPNYLDYYIKCRIGGDCILEGRVLNLITKERYYYKPMITTMMTALRKMREICIKNHITKIAMPTIGAGLDKLNWDETSEILRNIFSEDDIDILVCKL